jgi:hypothetical protein
VTDRNFGVLVGSAILRNRTVADTETASHTVGSHARRDDWSGGVFDEPVEPASRSMVSASLSSELARDRKAWVSTASLTSCATRRQWAARLRSAAGALDVLVEHGCCDISAPRTVAIA